MCICTWVYARLCVSLWRPETSTSPQELSYRQNFESPDVHPGNRPLWRTRLWIGQLEWAP